MVKKNCLFMEYFEHYFLEIFDEEKRNDHMTVHSSWKAVMGLTGKNEVLKSCVMKAGDCMNDHANISEETEIVSKKSKSEFYK